MTALGFRPNLDGFFDASLDLQMHVYRRTEAALAEWGSLRGRVTTADDVRGEQERIRAAVLAGVGGLPDVGEFPDLGGTPNGDAAGGDSTSGDAASGDAANRGSTNVGPVPWESTGLIDGDGYVVEKLIYESLPGTFVTANLYRPLSTGSGGAVLFVCGHSEEAKAYPPYQRVCGRLARAGLVVLAIDPPGQGERLSYLDDAGAPLVEWGTTEHTYAGVQCWWLGHSPARWFVHDARRGIDLLSALPEVDPARVGVTGNSGGGTLTTLLMALEPRLAAAAPGTFVSGRGQYLWSGQRQDAEQILLGGTAAGVDHADFLIAMAPRPVLVLAVEYDFFPYEATLETVDVARRYFELAGSADALRLVSSPAMHGYDDVLGRAATEFFAEHLGGKVTDGSRPHALESKALQCTRSGQVIRDRPKTRRIFDLNLVEYERCPQVDVSEARGWLTERVHAHRRVPERPTPRWLGLTDEAGSRGQSAEQVSAQGVAARPGSGERVSSQGAPMRHGSGERASSQVESTEQTSSQDSSERRTSQDSAERRSSQGSTEERAPQWSAEKTAPRSLAAGLKPLPGLAAGAVSPRFGEGERAALRRQSPTQRPGIRGFWRSEVDLWNAGVLLGATPPRSSADGTVLPAEPPDSDAIHLALLDRGTAELTSDHRVHDVAGDDALLVLDVRGTGALTPYDRDGKPPPDMASSTYKLNCDLMWLDDSLSAGQVFDVVHAVDLLVSGQLLGWSPSRIHLYGEGIGALHVLLAAAIDERIATVTVHEPTVDVDALIRRRYHDNGRGEWRAVLPGLAAHVPPYALEELVRGRVS